MTDQRVLSWFSCGAASAVTAKLAVEKYGDQCEVLYCDTFAYEHPDNRRFFADVEKWIGRKIKILRSEDYSDIYDVFQKTRFLIGPRGARCTTELKKNVRKAYQRVDDIHALGYTAGEAHRIALFAHENHELLSVFPLFEAGITKDDCYRRVLEAGIALPAMYMLGYHNNNCIGCVKGGMGYWNKIRRDFPDMFEKMAKMERELNHSLNRQEIGNRDDENHRVVNVFLDDLRPDQGRKYKDEPVFECGAFCHAEQIAAAPSPASKTEGA